MWGCTPPHLSLRSSLDEANCCDTADEAAPRRSVRAPRGAPAWLDGRVFDYRRSGSDLDDPALQVAPLTLRRLQVHLARHSGFVDEIVDARSPACRCFQPDSPRAPLVRVEMRQSLHQGDRLREGTGLERRGTSIRSDQLVAATSSTLPCCDRKRLAGSRSIFAVSVDTAAAVIADGGAVHADGWRPDVHDNRRC